MNLTLHLKKYNMTKDIPDIDSCEAFGHISTVKNYCCNNIIDDYW